MSYVASPYHCPAADGRIKQRGKPQSRCPRPWKGPEAREALRRALLKRNVSEFWENGYPRYIWYCDGENLVYEARLSGGRPGSYHAYPIEPIQVPKGVEL